MTGFLLDTNVISELTRDDPDSRVVRFLDDEGDLWLSSVVVYEMEYGLATLPQGRRLARLRALQANILAAFGGRLLSLDQSGARWAAELRAQARHAGRAADVGDALIAGTARAHGLAIATRNVRDFEGMDIDNRQPLGLPMTTLAEADAEDAALGWLVHLGWQTAHGPDIAPDTPNAERADYGEMVLERRLRDALAALNRGLPVDALADAFRKLTRPPGHDRRSPQPRLPPHARKRRRD